MTEQLSCKEFTAQSHRTGLFRYGKGDGGMEGNKRRLGESKTLNKEKMLFIIYPKKDTRGHWKNPDKPAEARSAGCWGQEMGFHTTYIVGQIGGLRKAMSCVGR